MLRMCCSNRFIRHYSIFNKSLQWKIRKYIKKSSEKMTCYNLKIKVVDVLFIILLLIVIPLLIFYVSSKGLPMLTILIIYYIVLMLALSVLIKKINKVEKELEELRASLKANNTSPDNTAGKK